MELLDFVNLIELKQLGETAKAKYLCYYHYKETGEDIFSMSMIADLFESVGFNKPNVSRLKNNLLKGKEKAFLEKKQTKDRISFIPVILQQIEREYSQYWCDYESIYSNSEVLDESKFCGKRSYLDKLITQINCTYKNNCYDACAVLMRRLFEVILILAYQNLKIDMDIKAKDGSGYCMLDGIISDAKSNHILNLSRIKSEFDTLKRVGNFSAHGITYIASRKDIEDIKLSYRVMLEELFNKAGLMEE